MLQASYVILLNDINKISFNKTNIANLTTNFGIFISLKGLTDNTELYPEINNGYYPITIYIASENPVDLVDFITGEYKISSKSFDMILTEI